MAGLADYAGNRDLIAQILLNKSGAGIPGYTGGQMPTQEDLAALGYYGGRGQGTMFSDDGSGGLGQGANTSATGPSPTGTGVTPGSIDEAVGPSSVSHTGTGPGPGPGPGIGVSVQGPDVFNSLDAQVVAAEQQAAAQAALQGLVGPTLDQAGRGPAPSFESTFPGATPPSAPPEAMPGLGVDLTYGGKSYGDPLGPVNQDPSTPPAVGMPGLTPGTYEGITYGQTAPDIRGSLEEDPYSAFASEQPAGRGGELGGFGGFGFGGGFGAPEGPEGAGAYGVSGPEGSYGGSWGGDFDGWGDEGDEGDDDDDGDGDGDGEAATVTTREIRPRPARARGAVRRADDPGNRAARLRQLPRHRHMR